MELARRGSPRQVRREERSLRSSGKCIDQAEVLVETVWGTAVAVAVVAAESRSHAAELARIETVDVAVERCAAAGGGTCELVSWVTFQHTPVYPVDRPAPL